MSQTLQIAGLPSGLPGAADIPVSCADHGLELVPLAGGNLMIGAERDGFAYDNERPRHQVEVASFQIGRFPVSNAAWADFIAAGGYARAASCGPRPAGAGAKPRASRRRSTGAATTGPDASTPARRSSPPTRSVTSPTSKLRPSPATTMRDCPPSSSGRPQPPSNPGARRSCCTGSRTAVWQWTASEFQRYPGFRADPYPEYSEQFFGHGYRVLRGGAWLSSPRVATITFRNWDLPERRQIFSGLRLARDL